MQIRDCNTSGYDFSHFISYPVEIYLVSCLLHTFSIFAFTNNEISRTIKVITTISNNKGAGTEEQKKNIKMPGK